MQKLFSNAQLQEFLTSFALKFVLKKSTTLLLFDINIDKSFKCFLNSENKKSSLVGQYMGWDFLVKNKPCRALLNKALKVCSSVPKVNFTKNFLNTLFIQINMTSGILNVFSILFILSRKLIKFKKPQMQYNYACVFYKINSAFQSIKTIFAQHTKYANLRISMPLQMSVLCT